MLAALVIFLREGVEASMIIAILLAYLNRIGRRDHFRDVFVGVGAAVLIATAGGRGLPNDPQLQRVTGADDIRDYHLSGGGDGAHLHDVLDAKARPVAVDGPARPHGRGARWRARWGLGLLAFQAVGREGLETVAFTLAIIFSTSAASALSGAAIGLAGAARDRVRDLPAGQQAQPGEVLHDHRRPAHGLHRRPARRLGGEPATTWVAAGARRADVAFG
jgi:high-affinity iron transporter